MTALGDAGRTQLDAGFYQRLLDAGVADKDARELARMDAFGGSDPELWIEAVRDGQLPQPPAGDVGPELAAAIENARDALYLGTSALVTACEFVARGWAPIPIPRRSKIPRIKGWQELRIDAATVPQYFNGRAQNVGVLLGAPSGGLVDVDLDAPESVQLAAAFLPATDAVFGRPGKRRSHWLYRVEPLVDTTKFTDVDEGATGTGGGPATKKTTMLVEIRSTGAQTVFPGSAHEDTGELIAWERHGDPAEGDGAQLVAGVARLASAALLARHWPAAGSRQETAMALAAVLLRGGWKATDVEAFLRAIAQVAGDEEAEKRAEAVEFTAKRVTKDQATTGWKRLAELVGTRVADRVKDWLQLREPDPLLGDSPAPAPPIGAIAPASDAPEADDPLGEKLRCTDTGNAERLVRQHGRDLRYCHDWSKWLVWDGKRWAKDEDGAAFRRAIATARSIFQEVGRAETDDERKRLSRHAFESESARKLREMLYVAERQPMIAVTSSQLDTDIWTLTCTNGTLDLRTGQLRPHARTDLITRLAPVAYDPAATCPIWERFLETILPDESVRDFVQRAAGYSLTGSVAERTLLVLWGGGRNGKSTMMETLHLVWGDYALMTPPETILTKRESGGIPNDVARLKGARLVSVNETENDRRLAESVVKQMVGGDTMTARFLRAEFFEFRPQFTPWLRTNHRPQIRGTDKAIWDRIKLVPFTVRISDEQEDKGLLDKLKAELPGILAWAVRGCLLWQTVGLAAPPAVEVATDAYRVDMDTLAAFLDEYCEVGAGRVVTVKRLYGEYEQWAKSAHETVWTQRQFNAALKERGFTSERERHGYEWKGLGLSTLVLNATPSP